MAAAQSSFKDLGLSIIGVASQYPPYGLPPEALETLAKRFYPDTPACVPTRPPTGAHVAH
jgi:fungal type III polyketide synthase